MSSPRALVLSVVLITLTCGALRSEEPPDKRLKHLTLPFKTVAAPSWAPDGSYYIWEIEDKVLGRQTLTVRIVRVGADTYTVAADGTDWETTFPLPAEANAGAVLRAKKKELGEPPAADKRVDLIRFCIGARYFRYAEAELAELQAAADQSAAGLAAELLEARVRAALVTARELSLTGQLEDAGRVLANAFALLAAPGAAPQAGEHLRELERHGRELQVQFSAEAQARAAWQERVRLIREALEGARGPEARLIESLLPDLDGPLPAARRTEILYELHAAERQRLNYSQALEALKEFSFAVRYSQVLKKQDTPGLDAFFAAEALVNACLAAPEAEAPRALEAVLELRGLSDRALAALVRHGRRVGPPPAPAAGQSPQGPFSFRARTGELEIAADYLVMLPVDYHPSRPRPLLVALHGTYAEARTALEMWAPEALKRGWLVLAPECVIGRGKGYLSEPEERALVHRAINDCCERFAVDPNRIYLAGHSMGAHNAWDLALTTPDRFAAAVAICGCVSGVSAHYLSNLLNVPMYCVSGDRDTRITRVNRLVQEELKKHKVPWTYVECPGRGHETFLDQMPRIFAWLDERVRPRAPEQVDFVSADIETSRVHWLMMLTNHPKPEGGAGGPDKFPLAIRSTGLARLSGALRSGNLAEIQTRNLPGLRVWISDDLFDLTKPLRVILNRRSEVSIAFPASRRKMLDIVRRTGDRERLYWATVDLPVPR